MKRADSYFAKGEYLKAEIEYRNAARLGKTLDPHIVNRIAAIYYEQGRVFEAFPVLTNAVALKPDDLALSYKLGSVWAANRNFDEARNAALTILAKQPKHADAMLLLAEIAASSSEIDAARKKLNEILSSQGETWAAHAALAQLALRQGQTNEAEREIQLAAKLDSKAPAVNIMLAQLASSRHQVAQAEKFLRAAAENSPPRSPHRLLLPQYKLSNTNVAEAKAILDDLLKKTPDYLPAWALRGQIAIGEKDFETCARIAKTVLAWDPLSYEIRLLSARALVLQKQPDKAIEEFERLLAHYDRIPELSYEAAAAQIQKGDAGEALKKLNHAIRLNPDYEDAVVLRAQVQLRTGAANEAVASLSAYAKNHPNSIRAYTLLGDAYRFLGKWDEALAVYRALAQAIPGAPEFRSAAGSVLIQLKRPDEAKQWFDQALQVSPTYTIAADQLIDLALLRRDVAGAQRIADQQLALTSDSIPSLMMQAKVALATTNWTLAEKTLDRVLKRDPNSVAALSLLASISLEKNDVKTALSHLETAAARNPQDITSRLLLASTYRDRLKQFDKAKEMFEAVLKIQPATSGALNDFAWLLAKDMNRLDEALPYAAKAHDLAPNNPEFADTLGWIYYRRGDLPMALPLLTESAKKMPQSAEANFHLGMAHYSVGDETAARADFARVIQLDDAFAKAQKVQSNLAILDVDPKNAKAIGQLEAAARENDRDFFAAWKLGEAYYHAGSAEKARAALERAAKLNPTAPQPMITLAFVLAEKLKDYPKALEAARAARKLAPDNVALAGLLGRLSYRTHDYGTAVPLLQEYVRSGKADADALYDLALAQSSFGQTIEARANLNTYLATPGGTRLVDGKELLALIDFQDGKADARKAESVAQARLQKDASDVPSLATLGFVAQQNGKYSEAAQKFEQALGLSKQLPLLQRQLAILYADQLQDDRKALEFGSKARLKFPNDPDLAIALGKASYRTGDFSSAVRLLNEGLNRQTNATAYYFLGMSYHKLLKKSEAKAALSKALASNLDPNYATTAASTLKEL
jgi:tetratricopeptide (TPR) repeat protein